MTTQRGTPIPPVKAGQIRRALSPAMLSLLIGLIAIQARAQTQVTVPGNASGHFGNPSDLLIPLVRAITVNGPATIKISYASGTVTGIGGVTTGPEGVPWDTHGNQTPLQEGAGVAGGTVPNVDALIGAFVAKQRYESTPGFSAIDGTKGVVPVGIVPQSLFFVGDGITYEANEAGRLYLGINDWFVGKNRGAYKVNVSIVPRPYNASADYSSTSNPNGVWSYGWTQSRGATFNLFPNQTPVSGMYIWTSTCCGAQAGPPGDGYNETGASITVGTVTVPAKTLWFSPGPDDENSVIRWTAPANGTYQIKAVFWGDDFVGPTSTNVAVLHNGATLYVSYVTGFGPSSDQSYTGTVRVNAGDTVDFTVGYGTDGNYGYDSTGVSAVITPED
jgi:hypothetical protein